MDKQTLRKTYLQKRMTLSDGAFALKNEGLLNQIKSWWAHQPAGPVHIFLPIRKFREADTWPLIRWCWAGKTRVITSITDTRSNALHHVWLDAQTPLVENKWGIPEPAEIRPADPSQCSAVFVPLIVFDLELNRIGYGKGYYDKFLSTLPPGVKKVGLSLAPPLDLIPYAEPHDIKVDAVIWPGGIVGK